MRNLTKRIAQTAVVLVLLAQASPLWAGNERPLKASITVVPYPEGGPNARRITGIVSHLGRVQGINYLNATFPTFTGEFVLFAANGDSIFGTDSGTLAPDPDTPGVFLVTEHIEITGGTGRFAGATGSADGTGHVDGSTFEAHETFEGTISY